MSDANIRRLVATLGRMRGAALKLGQFMSIQGLSSFQHPVYTLDLGADSR